MATEKISRRKALKTLAAAASGLGAAAFLPAKWLKPVIQSGVAPAHAQTSGVTGTLTIIDQAGATNENLVLTITPIAAYVRPNALDGAPGLESKAGGDLGKGVPNCNIKLSYRSQAKDLGPAGTVTDTDPHLVRYAKTGSDGSPANFGTQKFTCSSYNIRIYLVFSWNGQTQEEGPYVLFA